MTKEFKVGDRVRLKAEHAEYWNEYGIAGPQIITQIRKEINGALAMFGNPPSVGTYTFRLEHVPPAVTIDPARTYRTRDGREVRIYATDGSPEESAIHGATKDEDGWSLRSWTASGRYYEEEDSEHDLIEVKPEHEGWVNVYHVPGEQGHGPVYANKAEADHFAQKGRIACLHLKFREGDGIEGGK